MNLVQDIQAPQKRMNKLMPFTVLFWKTDVLLFNTYQRSQAFVLGCIMREKCFYDLTFTG